MSGFGYNVLGFGAIAGTVDAAGAFRATGGTVTAAGVDLVHTFTSSGTFAVAAGTTNVSYLVIAGGGGGGKGDYIAGAGGAGGYRNSFSGASTTEKTGGGGDAEPLVSATFGLAELVPNHELINRGDLVRGGDLHRVGAIALVCWDAAGRSVRLHHEAKLLEFGEDATHRCR